MNHIELTEALRELGLTRAELGELCGVHRETVYRWMRGPDIKGSIPVPKYVETIIAQRRAIMRLESQVREAAEQLVRARLGWMPR